MSVTQVWRRAFLAERPSVMLGLFRIAVAVVVGCHMIPSLLELTDNYLPGTSFREYNTAFFPLGLLRLVDGSPAWVVQAFTALFVLSWCAFLIGLCSQISCILMTASCYYFDARNSLHIGTLSFDILLVTLFLMCVTGYHGDSWSVDSVLRGVPRLRSGLAPSERSESRGGDAQPHRRLRPFFIQRLLQLQIAWTFWYTALSKITVGGNWLTGNPYYALMHYPAGGVVRAFPGRAWLAQHPQLCYGLGVALVVFECMIPFLWFWRRTRVPAVALGIAFQWMLLFTLHVPTIFFFLFPPMMCLFLPPEWVADWVDRRRTAVAEEGRQGRLVYDGQCGFCRASLRRLLALDWFGYVKPVDYHAVADPAELYPELTRERCHSELLLIEPHGRLSGGFAALRRLSLRLPSLWWAIPLVWWPGMGWLGGAGYRWIAAHRYFFHWGKNCETNQCRR